MMKVILTGSTSQLGHAIISNKPKNIDLLAFSRKELDLTSKKECTDVINKNNPDWIINAAAYTKVDLAEDYGELAMTINSKAPEIFSKVLKDKGGKLIQISTDYVFNGSVNTPYNTNNKRNPLGQYGLSKASGEQAIERIFSKSGQYIILRTSWLMGPIGENFIKTMLKLHSSRNKIEVVYDQIGSPTSTFSLARICWEIIRQYSDLSNKDKVLPSKLHWSNAGIASWYDLAVAIGEISLELGLISKVAEVIPILSCEYPSKAKRPNYSVLNCSLTSTTLNVKPTYWREDLKDILTQIKQARNT